MSNSLRCLMIGQAGIGKTSLLKAIPNAKLLAPEESRLAKSTKETYLINANDLHGGAADAGIEIQNVDITIETCLHENDLIVNNTVIPSNHIIGISNIDVIIFCFAFDDVNSFHLIRSKWDIYLKKMRKDLKNRKFILVGMKSDLVPSGKKNEDDGEKQRSGKKTADIKVVYKKRSVSVNSIASTSKLQSKKKRIISESETPSLISNNSCKKFAKVLRAKYIKVSNLETSNEHTMSLLDGISTCRKAIETSASSTTFKRTATFKSKLPKSLSAPISTLVNRRTRKLIDAGETENTNVNEPNENENKNGGQESGNRFGRAIENISLKKKLSQLLTGLGTYVVTCGSKHKSRKLINNKPSNDTKQPSAATKNSPLRNANNLLMRKNKSWLLLGSDASLNSLTNEDEVFA